MFERHDDRQSQHRHMPLKACRQIDAAQIDPLPSISTQTAGPMSPNGHLRIYTALTDATFRPPHPAVDVADPAGLEESEALRTPYGAVQIALNSSAARRNQSNKFLADYFSASVQHAAFEA
jgi:4-hydroxyphenylpyruvate dioxygenase-like putative hemolysin